MKNIVVYGGAFNPPTIAHAAITQAAANFAETINAELWLMPSGDRRDKTINVQTEKRIEFMKALISSINTSIKVSLCTYELFKTQTQTIDTVKYFVDKYPQHSFTWLFGSDSIQTMPYWSSGEKLISNLNMLVVQRKGNVVDLTENMTLLDAEVPMVSSTEVRRNLSMGVSISGLVPDDVYSLISNGLKA